jgi:hypothetical protein
MVVPRRDTYYNSQCISPFSRSGNVTVVTERYHSYPFVPFRMV